VTADSVIRLVPPLILTTAEADEIVARLTPWSRPCWPNEPLETAMKHYLQFSDFTADEYAYLLERAASSRRSSRATKSTTRWPTARWP
jgi:hypothetical protein